MNPSLRVLSVFVLVSAAVPASAQDAEVVTLGEVGPLSGQYANYGIDSRNAMAMAIDDLNAKQLVIGGKKIRFVLEAEDDAADPRQGTAAAQKLCDKKVNGVVGHVNSGTTIPASRIYNECGIPHISQGATNPALTRAGYKTTFRILANDNALGAGVALFAAKGLKLTRVAVVDDRTAYGQGIAEVFKTAAKANGIKVVDEQYTNDKTSDFSAILTSIKANKPQAIFFGGADGQGGLMLRQMTQLGMSDVRLLGGDGICTAKLAELAAGVKALDQVICAEGGASIAKMPGGKAWKARYDARFPGQFAIYSPYTYDAAMVLADAMVRANSTDPKVYGPKLFETDYRGVTTTVRFDSTGELRNPAMTLYTFKDGVKSPLN